MHVYQEISKLLEKLDKVPRDIPLLLEIVGALILAIINIPYSTK